MENSNLHPDTLEESSEEFYDDTRRDEFGTTPAPGEISSKKNPRESKTQHDSPEKTNQPT